MSSHRARVALLFYVAFALRSWFDLVRLPAWVDNDEAVCGLLARNLDWSWATLTGYTECMPSVVFLWHKLALGLFGDDLLGLRLGSAVLGALTVVLVYDFSRTVLGATAAFWGAVLLAVNHTHIAVSRIGHNPVITPFVAALTLCLLARSRRARSPVFLTVLAGVVLGLGSVSYTASHLLLVVIPVVFVGVSAGHIPRRRFAYFVGAALLTAAPGVWATWSQRATASVRPHALFRWPSWDHATAAVTMWVKGPADHFLSYSTPFPFLDVALAVVLVPALVLLVRRKPRWGWSVVFVTVAYWTAGVLCAPPVTYHRIVVVLLFLLPAAAWFVWRIGGTWAVVVFCALSAYTNLTWYFRDYPRIHRLEHRTGFTLLACRYAGTHVVLDATNLAGVSESVPVHNNFLLFQCPGLELVRLKTLADVENRRDFVPAGRCSVLIVPDKAWATRLGYVDTSIQWPEPLPLRVVDTCAILGTEKETNYE